MAEHNRSSETERTDYSVEEGGSLECLFAENKSSGKKSLKTSLESQSSDLLEVEGAGKAIVNLQEKIEELRCKKVFAILQVERVKLIQGNLEQEINRHSLELELQEKLIQILQSELCSVEELVTKAKSGIEAVQDNKRITREIFDHELKILNKRIRKLKHMIDQEQNDAIDPSSASYSWKNLKGKQPMSDAEHSCQSSTGQQTIGQPTNVALKFHSKV